MRDKRYVDVIGAFEAEREYEASRARKYRWFVIALPIVIFIAALLSPNN